MRTIVVTLVTPFNPACNPFNLFVNKGLCENGYKGYTCFRFFRAGKIKNTILFIIYSRKKMAKVMSPLSPGNNNHLIFKAFCGVASGVARVIRDTRKKI